jgi:exosortase
MASAPKSQIMLPRLLPVVGLVAVLAAAYVPVLRDLAGLWEANPQYSHGYLVPVFAVGLLWLRRDQLKSDRLRPSIWGLPLIAAGLALRHLGGYLDIDFLEQLSLIGCLPGVVIAIGGYEALRWSWPSLAFLLFMLPMPYRLEVALQGPLQRIGTLASTFVMQTIGLPAISTGNVIDVNGEQINVAEACSGLSMLTIFFALSTAVAMLSRRPLVERLFVVASALPIAILANVFRITLVGSLYFVGVREATVELVHDWAALYMMPLALGLLWMECAYLSRLIVEEHVDALKSPLTSLAGIPGYRDADSNKKMVGSGVGSG